MLTAGINIAVVSKWLGHSSMAITGNTDIHVLEGVGRDASVACRKMIYGVLWR